MANMQPIKKDDVKKFDFNKHGHLDCECGSYKFFVSKMEHEGYQCIASKCIDCWNIHIIKLDLI